MIGCISNIHNVKSETVTNNGMLRDIKYDIDINNDKNLEPLNQITDCKSEGKYVLPDRLIEDSTKPVENLQSLLIMMAISTKECTDLENNNNHIICQNATEIDDNNKNIKVSSVLNLEDMNFLNIIPLKSENTKRQEILMRIYVDKWKMFVQNKQNHLTQLRKSALDNFFEKLDKKNQCMQETKTGNKSKISLHDYNTYQHR